MICNANHGIVVKSLSLGIPVVSFPLYIENRWNATVVQQLGFGVNLSGLPTTDWRRQVDDLIASPAVQQRLPTFATELATQNQFALQRARSALADWVN